MKKTAKRVLALILTVILILPVQCAGVFAADGGWRENYLHDSKQPLCSGDYRISSALNESKCLDIDNGSLDNNGKVILHKAGQSNASQVFRFTYKGDGYYEIMNLNCDKYLDVDHGYTTAGTKVLTYTRNNSSNQLWKLEPGSDGYWMISSKCNGLYLDVKSGKTSDGTQIQVWGKNNTAAQKWKITQKNVTSELKISGAGSPGKLAVGKTWSCTGKITSNYKIIDVTGEIVGSYKKSVNPRKGSFDLKNSAIDKALLFNKLKSGTYTYRITAKDMSNRTFTLVDKSFTVGDPGKTSTLKISSAGSPGTLTKGKTWSCTGKITSNYKITKVVGEIVGKYSKTVKPNKTSYSLKNSAIDKALLFNKLGAGTYTYKITATDASGTTKTLVNSSFKVEAPPSSSGSSDYTKWKQTNPDWNKSQAWTKSQYPNAEYRYLSDGGCVVTSIAMLLRHYNVVKETDVNKFNPWICNEKLKSVNAFNKAADIIWTDVKKAYPGFRYVGNKKYSLSELRSLYKKGYACIVQVNGGGHYVAVRSVSSSDAKIMDPGSTKTSISKCKNKKLIYYFAVN